ncbi:hypothetical protein [Actinomadura violacea]|uniref:Integral membrane protein n=1 Tax=Actinomadura violacea TaxID=2819934 RepID=A0ABS3RU34_9ACTN|nr:hypothetical protein [Actinomadura violacea]MBO2460282.1 hypothetical protein [Actinomadura violacea]
MNNKENRKTGGGGPAPGEPARTRGSRNWLVATIAGSLWLLVAAVAHVAGAVSQRSATAVMQPLTADHQVTAIQATTLTYLVSAPIYWGLLAVGRKRLGEARLRDAAPPTETAEKRDRWLSRLPRAVRWFPPAHRLLSRLVEWEKKHRWVLTVLPFLVGFVGANILAQFYAARLPFSTGNAITTFGPITLGLVLVWRTKKESTRLRKDRDRALKLFLTLFPAAGAAMMIPWGQHIDGAGVLAALGGAVCSTLMVSSSKDMADAKIALKGTGLPMAVGLVLGAPSLITVPWGWEVGRHAIIGGLLVIAGAVLYWLAQGPLRLPKRLAGALAANGPALSGLVGLTVLNQALGLLSLIGIGTILVGSLLNAALTGSPEERAKELARYGNKAPDEEPKAHHPTPDKSVARTRSASRRARRRPPSWSAQVRKRKAQARTAKRRRKP